MFLIIGSIVWQFVVKTPEKVTRWNSGWVVNCFRSCDICALHSITLYTFLKSINHNQNKMSKLVHIVRHIIIRWFGHSYTIYTIIPLTLHPLIVSTNQIALKSELKPKSKWVFSKIISFPTQSLSKATLRRPIPFPYTLLEARWYVIQRNLSAQFTDDQRNLSFSIVA